MKELTITIMAQILDVIRIDKPQRKKTCKKIEQYENQEEVERKY